MRDLLISVFGTLIAGVLTYLCYVWFFLMYIKKRLFSGSWDLYLRVEKSGLASLVGIRIKYRVNAIDVSGVIDGVAEKISETSVGKDEFFYDRAKRVHASFSGHRTIDFFPFGMSVVLLVTENGRIRSTSSVFKIRYKNGKFFGVFVSTAADSSGTVEFEKVL